MDGCQVGQVVFKINHEDDLRRWTCDDATISYDGILVKSAALFTVPSEEVRLRYVDSDGDYVTLMGPEDVAEMMAEAAEAGTKLTIRLSMTLQKPSETSGTTDTVQSGPLRIEVETEIETEEAVRAKAKAVEEAEAEATRVKAAEEATEAARVSVVEEAEAGAAQMKASEEEAEAARAKAEEEATRAKAAEEVEAAREKAAVKEARKVQAAVEKEADDARVKVTQEAEAARVKAAQEAAEVARVKAVQDAEIRNAAWEDGEASGRDDTDAEEVLILVGMGFYAAEARRALTEAQGIEGAIGLLVADQQPDHSDVLPDVLPEEPPPGTAAHFFLEGLACGVSELLQTTVARMRLGSGCPEPQELEDPEQPSQEAAGQPSQEAAGQEVMTAPEGREQEERDTQDLLTQPLVAQLVVMGFDPTLAKGALEQADGDMQGAVEALFRLPQEATIEEATVLADAEAVTAAVAEIDMEIADHEAAEFASAAAGAEAEARAEAEAAQAAAAWEEVLLQLAEMGFSNPAQNREALVDANGCLKDAVKELVRRERL